MGIDVNPIYYHAIDHKLGKADKRRLSIIQIAIKSIAEDGIEGANFERIARKLNLRRSHIVYYYEDRDALVLATVRYVVALAQEITASTISSADSARDKILAINKATFSWANMYWDHVRVLIIFYSHCANQSAYRKLNTELRDIGSARIAELLKLEGIKGTATQLMHKARSIQSVMTGHIIEYVACNSELKFEDMSALTIKQIIDAK
jgi:DNA-binding transcriptional regulator YbjK